MESKTLALVYQQETPSFLVLVIKATSEPNDFCTCLCEIKDTDYVLPVKDGAVPVLAVIHLNFAYFALPTHGNH